MKVLFVSLCVVAAAFAVPQNQVIFAEGPACPIDDPLTVPGPVAINVTLDPLLKLLEGSQLSNLVAEGLSTLHYNVDINAIALSARFEVTLARGTGNATFNAEGYLDARPLSQTTIPSGNLTGSGLAKIAATDLHIKGTAALWVNLIGNKVTVRTLNLEIVSFGSLSLDFADTTVGGEKPDWAELSRNLKENFDREFAQYKNEVTDKIRLAANNIIGKYTLAELIDLITNPPGGGGGDCEEGRH